MFTICNNIDYQRVNLLLSPESMSDWREKKRDGDILLCLVGILGRDGERRSFPAKSKFSFYLNLEKMNELLFALFSNQA